MKKAIYTNDDGSKRELVVIKENPSGTVELGTEDGVLVVGNCPVGGKAGQCTVDGKDTAKVKAEK